MGATGDITEEYTNALLEAFDAEGDGALSPEEYTGFFGQFVNWTK